MRCSIQKMVSAAQMQLVKIVKVNHVFIAIMRWCDPSCSRVLGVSSVRTDSLITVPPSDSFLLSSAFDGKLVSCVAVILNHWCLRGRDSTQANSRRDSKHDSLYSMNIWGLHSQRKHKGYRLVCVCVFVCRCLSATASGGDRLDLQCHYSARQIAEQTGWVPTSAVSQRWQL